MSIKQVKHESRLLDQIHSKTKILMKTVNWTSITCRLLFSSKRHQKHVLMLYFLFWKVIGIYQWTKIFPFSIFLGLYLCLDSWCNVSNDWCFQETASCLMYSTYYFPPNSSVASLLCLILEKLSNFERIFIFIGFSWLLRDAVL